MKLNVALLALGLALGSALHPTLGQAQDPSALEVVEQLNVEAMEAYHNMDIDRAGAMLEEALRVAQAGGVTGRPYATTNMNLGVVVIGGLNDQEAGIEYFRVAACVDPGSQLDPLTSTPDMQAAFATARQQAQSGNCPAGAGAAPVSTSPVAPSAVAPAVPMTGPQASLDNETPWDDREVEADLGEFRPFYFNLSLAFGLAYINAGMEADRPPPYGQTFITKDANEDEFYIPDPRGYHVMNEQIRVAQEINMMAPPGQETQDPGTPIPLYLPASKDRLNTAWVPDADSEDDASREGGGAQGPYGGSCPSDGTPTGPAYANPDTGDGLLPSKYCVRVNSAGLASTLGLRAGVGYFIDEFVGLGLVARLQFDAGEGSMANILFGPRVEFLVTDPDATGFYAGVFLGATMGQIQVLPKTDVQGAEPPWIISGPFGAHVGMNLRYRILPNFGFIFGPEVDVQFPDVLFNVDLPLGVEAAF